MERSTAREPRVWVVGSIHMDVVAFAERHPRLGETVMGSEAQLLPGGKGANQAIAARRSGVPVSLVGCLGEDAFADQLRAFLGAEGVDLEQTRSVAGAGTGIALVVVAESNNTIVAVPGAGGKLGSALADELDLGAEDVVVAQFESPLAASVAAFERAQASGALTVLNPAPVLPGGDRLLDAADVVVVNETELAVLSGAEDVAALAAPAEALAAAERIRRRPAQTVVVTLGAAGAVGATPEGPLRVDGRRVEAADTTGAGDCFVGNLAASLCRRLPIAAALETANLAASLSVQTSGAAVSMPRAEAIRAAAGRDRAGDPGAGAR